MELFLVAIGGGMGSLTRFKIGKMLAGRSGNVFPLGTFLVNVSGAILLGLLSGIYGDVEGFTYRFFGDGFLGAYTTFSTFMYEGFDYFKEKKSLNGIFYISLSLILGIAGFLGGFFAAKVTCG